MSRFGAGVGRRQPDLGVWVTPLGNKRGAHLRSIAGFVEQLRFDARADEDAASAHLDAGEDAPASPV